MSKIKNYVGWHLFDYYQWLLSKVKGNAEPYYNYSLLLSELHKTPFRYILTMDKNRAACGERLRWDFLDEYNIPDLFYRDGVQCSVLEMLIALSLDCDVNIMGNASGEGAYKWFWIMIDNLDLMKCSDDHFSSRYVHQQIDTWLDRVFAKDGKGSPFPLKKAHTDQRNVDIWFQMCGYLNENFL